MPLDIASFSYGHGGAENGDALGHAPFPDGYVLAIADGVGSAESSHETSRIAVEKALKVLCEHGPQAIPEAFEEARAAIRQRALELDAKSMSTTLTVCVLHGREVAVGHVGDTRLYHLRGLGLVTRTRDQTELQHLLDHGILSKDRARKYPRKNVLLSALSSSSSYELQTDEFTVEKGDRILLTTDGIHRLIPKKTLADIASAASSSAEFLEGIQRELLKRGLIDDSSALCVTMGR